MSNNIPITTKGFATIKMELKQLKEVERPAIITAIADAREHGDLKENAEYHSAKEKQSFIEGKIKELGDKIARAQTVDPSTITDTKIRFSATVELLNLDTEQTVIYQIVSEYEADLSKNLISASSPIARGLLGKQAGDEVIIRTPGGNKEYEIIKVEYV